MNWSLFFFFNDTATTEIYTLSLHDALPIYIKPASSMLLMRKDMGGAAATLALADMIMGAKLPVRLRVLIPADRKSTRLNSSHANISYAVFCLKKKKIALNVVLLNSTLQKYT